MSSVPEALRVWTIWTHNAVAPDTTYTYGATAADIIRKLCAHMVGPDGRIRRVFGNTLKRMTGAEWQGTHRMRRGQIRVLFDLDTSPDGALRLWVHDIFVKKSDDAYETRKPQVVRWHEKQKDLKLRRAAPDSTIPYRCTRLELSAAQIASQKRNIELWELSEDQDTLLKAIFPLNDDGRAENGWLRLIEGPPGSGKTVLGCRAACAAFNDRTDCDVLILVPAVRLKQQYRADISESLQANGLVGLVVLDQRSFQESLKQPIPAGDQTHVWIQQLDETFGSALANVDSGAIKAPDLPVKSRSALVQEWWLHLLGAAKFGQFRVPGKLIEIMSSPRFVRLLDAVLFCPAVEPPAERDALAEQDQKLRQAIDHIHGTPALRKFINESRRSANVKFRWEGAAEFEDKLASAHPGRQLLIVVDEAQDLVPAEWQALLEGTRRRREGGPSRCGETRIALLGDENQRVAPTCFSWTSVQKFESPAKTLAYA